ncbi:MAG: imidazole glycerol phosphate synthase subunit HisH [Pseudomonadota bacterium]|nr:imidazole glycerol phosphate synthase subunit HisH [Pseudomonadota bacterium]
MNRIAIIDYGMGNLHSMAKALQRVAPKAQVEITAEPSRLRSANRLIFPGQGAIGHCMEELQRRELHVLLGELVTQKPMLGVCLGLQAALEYSEENSGTDCLKWIPGRVRRFTADLRETPNGDTIRIPHMGWNRVEPLDAHPLWRHIEPGTRFYFVHSYYAPADTRGAAATTAYGVEFASALGQDLFFAVQFHPEKSQKAGLQLLENFANWDGGSH